MKFEEALQQLPGGWMGDQDARILFGEAKKVNGLIVEIGSYLGRSTKLMALASPKSKIIAIDPYPPEYYTGEDMDYAKNQFLKNTKGLNVELIQKTSEEVGKKWKDQIDFLHIDGDHSYRAVKSDIELFVPHLKKGGVALFHDYVINGDPGELVELKDSRYYDNYYGVVRALNELKHYFTKIQTFAGFALCRR